MWSVPWRGTCALQPAEATLVVVVVAVVVVVVVGRAVVGVDDESDPDEHAASSTTTPMARNVRSVGMVREGTGMDRG